MHWHGFHALRVSRFFFFFFFLGGGGGYPSLLPSWMFEQDCSDTCCLGCLTCMVVFCLFVVVVFSLLVQRN